MEKKKRIRFRPSASRKAERDRAIAKYHSDPKYRQARKDSVNKSKRKRIAAGLTNNYLSVYRKRRESWAIAAISVSKVRCKKLGIPFNISAEDIYVPSHCPVLGFELVFGGKAFAGGLMGPSLDRIYPEKGYVRGNVIVISMRANRLKCDCSSTEELRKVIDYIDAASTKGLLGIYPDGHEAHLKQTTTRPQFRWYRKGDPACIAV